MSMFYCSSCDRLVDSDLAPEFDYCESTKEWTCQGCIENEADDQRIRARELRRIQEYNDPLANWSGHR
jgi:hypothetical protein